MNQTSKSLPGHQIAGAAFALIALISLFKPAYGLFSMSGLLCLAAYIYLAVVLFLGKRGVLPAIGFLVLAVLTLSNFLPLDYFTRRYEYDMIMWILGCRRAMPGPVAASLLYFGGGYLSFFNWFHVIMYAAGYGCAAVAALQGEKGRKLRFVPPACLLASFVILFFHILLMWFGFFYYTFDLSFFGVIFRLVLVLAVHVILIAGLYFAADWCVFPNGHPRKVPAQAPGGYAGAGYNYAGPVPGYTQGGPAAPAPQPYQSAYAGGAGVLPESAFISMAMHVVLLFVTCGIWYLVWIYRTTAVLNCVPGEEERNPATKLLLCMFIPFYSIYWVYQSAQRIDKLSAANGQAGDSAMLCLILAIVLGIVAPIIMQDKINKIAEIQRGGQPQGYQPGYQQPTYQQPNYQQGPAPQQPYQQNGQQSHTPPYAPPYQQRLQQSWQGTVPQQGATPQQGGRPDAAEELKKFKELLDMGAITQEEYDEKKKQLLGL